MLTKALTWSIETIGVKNVEEFTLSGNDIIYAGMIYLLILFMTAYIGNISFWHDKKKLSWVISLLNSFVTMCVGCIYLAVKYPTVDGLFSYSQKNAFQVFHARTTNFSLLVCLWFAMASMFDLIFGFFFYRKYLDLLTAYIHHGVFIWICYAGTTGMYAYM